MTRTPCDILNGLGFKQIGKEAISTLTSSALLFPNVPKNTSFAQLTVRTQGITVAYDGTDPTASGVGIDYPPGTYEFDMDYEQLKTIRAIQQAASATCYVVYFGIK